MAGSVPVVPGREVVKALLRAGFVEVRVTGSHHLLRHDDGRVVAVPVHASRDLAPGTLRGILATIGMTADDLRRLL